MAVANTRVPDPAPCERGREVMAGILARVSGKWAIIIVAALSEGPMRYGELRRRVGGISQRMLTLTLKGLAEDGLVSRTAYPTVPPRVEYELTERGVSLRASLIPFRTWALQHMDLLSDATPRGVTVE